MKILGIETSTKTGSVAIVAGHGVMAHYSLNIEVTHSERLMATVDRVISDAGLTVADMDGFSVAIGPGSFTGLRIGLAAAKGLALATGKPLAAVPTLKALAWNVPHAAFPVCPLLDARKGEVYAAVYRSENGMPDQVMAESVLSIRVLEERLPKYTLFTGEGSLLFREELEMVFGERARFAPLAAALPSAAAVAEIGRTMLMSGLHADLDSLTPMYIRRPEAEVMWEKRTQSR